jgi:prepilin-type N-terminal cleavage/methylation domain-containing protein
LAPRSLSNRWLRQDSERLVQKSGGFTLVELLITLAVISILSLGLATFIATWLQTSSLAQARSNLLSNAETALDTINTDIQLSGSADLNNRWPDDNAPNAPTDQFSWKSDGSTLVLAKIAVDGSNNAIFSDPAKYITQKDNEIYYLSGQTLYRRTIASPDSNDAAKTTCPPAEASASCPADKTIATGVSNFSVGYYDANENSVSPSNARSIQLSITLTSTASGHTISASYNTRMVFRND